MVENKVKATATIVDLMTKAENSKVHAKSWQRAPSAIKDKRPNQAAPRIDFKARAAALKAEQNAEYARSSEERFRSRLQAAKEALAPANKRKEPEEIFEEAAKLAEQAQQVQAVVENSSCEKKLQWIHVVRRSPTRQRT